MNLKYEEILMREIVLETETSGITPGKDGYLVEIVCMEIVDGNATGNVFHRLIKPRELISPDVADFIGISNESVSDKPTFEQIADDLVEFLSTSRIVSHNAPFDIPFINYELELHNRPKIEDDHDIVDTLAIVRSKFPKERCTIVALAERYGIEIEQEAMSNAMYSAKRVYEIYRNLVPQKVKSTLD